MDWRWDFFAWNTDLPPPFVCPVCLCIIRYLLRLRFCEMNVSFMTTRQNRQVDYLYSWPGFHSAKRNALAIHVMEKFHTSQAMHIWHIRLSLILNKIPHHLLNVARFDTFPYFFKQNPWCKSVCLFVKLLKLLWWP